MKLHTYKTIMYRELLHAAFELSSTLERTKEKLKNGNLISTYKDKSESVPFGTKKYCRTIRD